MAQHKVMIAIAAGLLLLLSTLHLANRLQLPLYHDLEAWYSSVTTADELTYNSDNVTQTEASYLIGVGKADITGPVVEINFMGYADTNQVGSGLRQRLYSRAFIVGDVDSPNRWVYLVLDTQSGDTAVRYGILEALRQLGGEYALYGNQNLAVTGTHSHSGPGAWLNYLLPQITSKGFHQPSYQAIVDGAVESIKRAHEGLARGKLSAGTITWLDINVNRSPFAYQQNPYAERYHYGEHDVEKDMTVLKFTHTSDGKDHEVGILSWFPVHGTSMYGNNTLVTGDNKGVAAYLFEQSMAAGYVAGFSQANVGDTSPNVEGAFCEFGERAGEECDYVTSLCGGKTQPCHGRGPYWGLHDGGTASTFEIGRRQYAAAKTLLRSTKFEPITGPVNAAHRFVDFSNLHFRLPNGTEVKTCPAALGHSFAAGTSDGPGRFDFKQAQPGDPHTNPLWAVIGNRIHKPNETQIECHGVKPILLDVGESDSPYAWSPNIVDIQLFRVGQFFVIVSPGEATTMAGRRWKAAVREEASLTKEGGAEALVVLGGPANSYTHYITTEEEYSAQRYEGASTLYGPHTLAAYISQSRSLLQTMLNDATFSADKVEGPTPPINVNASLSFINEPVLDRAGFRMIYGQVLTDVKAQYDYGDSISATFVGANPRNNLRLGETFAAVEKHNIENDVWETVRDDEDWSLVYEWSRTSTVLGTSEVTITWETKWEAGTWIPLQARDQPLELPLLNATRTAASYRLKYYGDAKALGGAITPFVGTSSEFSFTE